MVIINIVVVVMSTKLRAKAFRFDSAVFETTRDLDIERLGEPGESVKVIAFLASCLLKERLCF